VRPCTNALLDALGSGHVGAALLDVTDPEPLPADHPLWTAPNVFITPHYSGAHPTYDEARQHHLFGQPPTLLGRRAAPQRRG
jgi:phosphoglycerate dehydrogenase-like enzyme